VVLPKSVAQGFEFAASTDPSEPRTRVEDGGRDPAQDHRSAGPSLDVARVDADRSVQDLDRVGRAKGAVQRATDLNSEALQRWRVLDAFAEISSRVVVLVGERVRQRIEPALGRLGVREMPGLVQDLLDTGAHRLGKVIEHVSLLMISVKPSSTGISAFTSEALCVTGSRR